MMMMVKEQRPSTARVAKTYEKIKTVYCELELRVGVAAVGGLIFKLAGF